MVSQRVLLYGRDEPLPEPTPLRAGPLTMWFDNGDLRTLRYGRREVVRRIYAAARDRAWGTAPNVLSDIHIDAHDDSFEIRYTCENRLNDLDFIWQGRILGHATGVIEFTFDGVARRAFLRNRLGFCVLHPPNAAGQMAIIEKVDGTTVRARFPRRIAPQKIVNGRIQPVAPFDEMRALSHTVAPGVTLHIAFEGEIFEMEDQRNWTDGSFKTYCTPLRLPFPIEMKEGERAWQKITLRVSSALSIESAKSGSRKSGVVPLTFSVLNSQFPIPQVGMCVSGDGNAITAKQAERLQALKIAHLRDDLPLWQADWKDRLKKAARDAALLGTKLELALFVSDAADEELRAFVAARNIASPSVARYLIFHRSERVTSRRWIELARQYLGRRATLYSGTHLFFTELNRDRPHATTRALLDGLCYSLNPQVHAFDNASLFESPEAQGETVRTFKTFAPGKPLAITPITLKPRWSLGDPGPEPAERRGEFDPRQRALLGASWTVASLSRIAQADGATSLTYYETTGQRGVMDGASVFPMYHVFADVAEFGGRVAQARSSDGLKVDGLALHKGKRLRVLLANLTNEPQWVQVKGIGEHSSVRMLQADNAEMAMFRPEAFRARPEHRLDGHTIALPPYAIARIDSSP